MIVDRIRQLIAQYEEKVMLRVFPIPYRKGESELQYLRRANGLLEKSFMQTSDLIENIARVLGCLKE